MIYCKDVYAYSCLMRRSYHEALYNYLQILEKGNGIVPVERFYEKIMWAYLLTQDYKKAVEYGQKAGCHDLRMAYACLHQGMSICEYMHGTGHFYDEFLKMVISSDSLSNVQHAFSQLKYHFADVTMDEIQFLYQVMNNYLKATQHEELCDAYKEDLWKYVF